MEKYLLIISTMFLFGACANKDGFAAKYYNNECNEYYDLQGYYHKDCKDDNIITYKEIGQKAEKAFNYVIRKEEKEPPPKPQGNVW